MSNFKYSTRFTLALVAFLPACSSPVEHKSGDYYVRFVTPKDNAVLIGLADVKIQISIPEEAAKYEVGVDGEPLTAFSKVSGNMRLNTTAMANGGTTLRVQLTGASGTQWSDKVNVQVKNAAHQLVNYRLNAEAYAKGETVILTLTYPITGLSLDADFSNLDDKFSKGTVTSKELGGGQYEVQYTLSPNDSVRPGRYEANITATNSHQEVVTTPIDIMFRSAPRLPINIKGGTFVDDTSIPFATTDGAPSIQSVSGASTLISGTPNKVTINWTAANQPADRVVVRSPDYSGYFVVPLDNATDLETTISIDLARAPRGTKSVDSEFLKLLLSTIDSRGMTGNWTPYALSTYHTEPAGTLVTLWWDNPVDLDLSVTDPLGNTISYAHNQADGGRLELDSNAMCVVDYRNTERISWPVGSELSGTYTVAANIYSACGQSGANYHLFISACGMTQELDGSFVASDVGTSNATKQIMTFDVNCSRRAHGVVLFEQPKILGDSQTLSAALVPIRAIAGVGASRQVITESTTNADGTFDFYLPDSAPTSYSLEAEASWTPPGSANPMAQVSGLWDTNVYRYATAASSQDQSSPDGQIVYVNVASDSGAFNILDKMQRGFSWVNGHFSRFDAAKVKPLRARWTMGKDSPGNDKPPQGSYYQGDVYVCGLQYMRDEFDDSVISHEFMHHVTDCIVDGNSPGGEHAFDLRANPALAWNEGSATALGQQALGYATYWDMGDKWTAAVNLEYRAQYSGFDNVGGADLGTADGTMTGKVSEILVAAVLWDLMDPVGDNLDSQDAFDATYPQTLGSMASYLPLQTRLDRGATGIDLVDFLDGWRCRWPSLTDQDFKLRMLLDERQFPYDYSTSINCQ